MQLIRTALLVVPFCVAVMLISGCEQKQPLVYVLEGSQDRGRLIGAAEAPSSRDDHSMRGL